VIDLDARRLAEPGGAGPRLSIEAEPLRTTPRHRLAALYGLVLLFGLTSLIWSLLAAALFRLLPAKLGQPLGRRVIGAGFRAFIGAAEHCGVLRCETAALDALAVAEPLVIVSNHPSLLDAALVMARVPQVVCAAKAPIWDNLLLGSAARLAGFVRNDSPTRLVREAIRQCRSGCHVLIFPEGTRSSAWPTGPFKGGFALIAKHAEAALQPVFIETRSRFLGKGWPLLKRPDYLPLVYRLRLGSPVRVAGDVHEAVERLQHLFQQELGAREPRS